MKRFILFSVMLVGMVMNAANPALLRTFSSLDNPTTGLLRYNPNNINGHVVVESYWEGLGKGGGEFVWVAGSNADTNTFSCFKSQSTDWTSGLGRWIAYFADNEFDAARAGARGDWPTTPSDNAAIQNIINTLEQTGSFGTVKVPHGTYGITNLIIAKTDGVSFSTVSGIRIVGEAPTSSEAADQVKFVVTDGNAAGVIIQQCDDCAVENINIIGKNSFFGEAKVDEGNFAGTFLTFTNFISSANTVSTNRYAPHAGIVIDPFSSTTPSQYPGLAAWYVGSTAGSTSVKIKNNTFTDLYAGFVVSPGTNVGGVHRLLADNNKFLKSTFGPGFGTSLIDFTVRDSQFRDVFTAFSTVNFGNGTGQRPYIDGAHAKFTTYLFQGSLSGTNGQVNDFRFQEIQSFVQGTSSIQEGTLRIVGSGYTAAGTKFLADDGTYKATGIGTPAGSDKQIQFNDAGVMGADADLTWTKTSNKMALGTTKLVFDGTNGRIGFGTTSPATGIDLSGSALAFGALTATLLGDNGSINPASGSGASYLQLQSDNATAANRTFKLHSGSTTGHLLVIHWVAQAGELLDDSTLSDTAGAVRLKGDWTPAVDDVLVIVYDGTDWVEISRSNVSGGAASDNWVASGTTNSVLYGVASIDALNITNNIAWKGTTNLDFTISSGSWEWLKAEGFTGDVRLRAVNLVTDQANWLKVTPGGAGDPTYGFYHGVGSPNSVQSAGFPSIYFDTGTTATPIWVKTNGTGNTGWSKVSNLGGGGGSGDALVANPLSQFAATTSAQLASTISDELDPGSGKLIFSPGTLNVTAAKTLAATASLTLSGTDSTTMTFPSTTATIARTDAANTFTGTQTFSGNIAASGASGLTFAAFNTSNSQFKVGTLELQSYSLNNAWKGENVYYDGANFVYRATGAAGLFYFRGAEGQFRFAASGSAGADTGLGSKSQLKINADGSFAVGPSVSVTAGSYSGSMFSVNPSGNTAVAGTLAVTGASTLTGGIVGKIDASDATAGNVGQFVSSLVAVGSPVSLTTATAANVTSISLTAGDWDVEGNANFSATTATVTGTSAGISTTSATLPTDGSEAYSGVQVTLLSETDSVTLPRKRVNVSGTTTVYLVGKSTFSAGTVGAFGSINARRIR